MNLVAELCDLQAHTYSAKAARILDAAVAEIERLTLRLAEATRLAAAKETETAQAWEQAGSDRTELNIALLEIDRLKKELYGDPTENELEADRVAIQRFQAHLAQDLQAAEERGRVATRIEWRGYLRKAIRRERELRQACEHALHKIEQTQAGQYPGGQALASAQIILSAALAAREVGGWEV